MKNRPVFITFEGCEGCGKSTHSKLILQHLINRNVSAILTREPGGTVAAEEIRKILLDQNLSLEHSSELLLHFAARVEHVHNVIMPSLMQNKIVICDRFYDSTIAYQHYGHGLDLGVMNQMHKQFLGDLTPDITFLLNIPDKVFLKRKDRKSSRYTDRYEQLNDEFHMRVRKGFLELASQNQNRYHVIDTSSTNPNDAHNKIIDIISRFI
ncbi:MAG: dTMP kinase [Rickettsiales bacterium]|nr:dTMP kinase [Rickettsiales bacterium]